MGIYHHLSTGNDRVIFPETVESSISDVMMYVSETKAIDATTTVVVPHPKNACYKKRSIAQNVPYTTYFVKHRLSSRHVSSLRMMGHIDNSSFSDTEGSR